MNNTKELPLSLRSDTFVALDSDFSSMLQQLIQGMVETNESSGTITIKMKVTLIPDFADTEDQQTGEITKPKFDHEVSAVIQRKDKRTGSLSGNYKLVKDGNGGYVMRPIDDGQCSLFGGDESAASGNVIDVQFQELPGGPKALPEATEVEGNMDTNEKQKAGNSTSTRSTDTKFEWLLQFVGESLHITEAMGNFSARTESNRVILSSAANPTADFYCPKEKLEPHAGHKIKCVGYGGDEIVTISIECEDCGDVLYTIERPEADEGESDASDPGAAREDGYDYENPEE